MTYEKIIQVDRNYSVKDLTLLYIYISLKSFQAEEMPKPEPFVDESNKDEVEYVDDSIYSGSST